MGKRSNKKRRKLGFYPTPFKAVQPLIPHLNGVRCFAEPCCVNYRNIIIAATFSQPINYFIDSERNSDMCDFLFSPRATISSSHHSIVLVRSILVHPETCGE